MPEFDEKEILRQLEAVAGIEPTPDATDRALEQVRKSLVTEHEKHEVSRTEIWRTIMKSRITKLAAAAVIAIVVLGGITLWPGGGPESGKWWLEPSTVWAKEILVELDEIIGVTCREQTMWIASGGSRHTSMTWTVFYMSHDSYRRDIYDGNDLREIQWYVPEGNDMLQTSVRFDLGSYFTARHGGGFGEEDPVDRMRVYVRVLEDTEDKRLLGEKVVEDHDCVGFEISASQYGDNPKEWLERIWLDVDTKLPVLIEHEIACPRDKTQTGFRPHIRVRDQFDYNPQLPGDTFIPEIPEDLIFGHPDDIQAARRKESEK